MDTPPQEARRRSALSEISIQDGIVAPEGIRTPVANVPHITPSTSPDELIIQTRGPRKIPVTWSPVDLAKFTTPSLQDHETPHKSPPKDLRRSVRKLRLFLTPEKNTSRNLFAEFHAKKLKLNSTSPSS